MCKSRSEHTDFSLTPIPHNLGSPVMSLIIISMLLISLLQVGNVTCAVTLDCGENGDCDVMNGNTSQPFCNCENGYTTGNSGKYCDVKVTSPPLPTSEGKPYNCIHVFFFPLFSGQAMSAISVVTFPMGRMAIMS